MRRGATNDGDHWLLWGHRYDSLTSPAGSRRLAKRRKRRLRPWRTTSDSEGLSDESRVADPHIRSTRGIITDPRATRPRGMEGLLVVCTWNATCSWAPQEGLAMTKRNWRCLGCIAGLVLAGCGSGPPASVDADVVEGACVFG